MFPSWKTERYLIDRLGNQFINRPEKKRWLNALLNGKGNPKKLSLRAFLRPWSIAIHLTHFDFGSDPIPVVIPNFFDFPPFSRCAFKS